MFDHHGQIYSRCPTAICKNTNCNKFWLMFNNFICHVAEHLFNKWQKYLHSGTIEEVQLGATLNVLPRTPLADNMDKFNIINHTGHINDWICTDNPSLDYKERLRRRIILQAHVERLGYPVFEAKNYVKQMFSQWAQVSALKNTIKEPELIGSLNY